MHPALSCERMTEKAKVSIEVHPAALLFPMMTDDELNKLADDIAANGLMEPIVTYQGQILDGRNRLAACELAGVEPKFCEATDVNSPTLYVLSKNLHRRHLTINQRAIIAAKIVPILQEEAAKKKVGNLKNQQVASKAPVGENDGRVWSTGIAAKAMQVGRRTVERVLEVKRKEPELYAKIENEELTPSAAEKMLPEKHKSLNGSESPYEPKTDHQKKLAEGQKERMVNGLSRMTGICRGLLEMDIRKAVAACDNEERKLWVDRAKELASQLRTFAGKLQKGF